MKDAKGHGSNARSGSSIGPEARARARASFQNYRGPAHQEGVNQVGQPPQVSPKAINIIAQNAQTGFSVRPTGEVPTKGFQVAVQGRTEPMPLDLKNIASDVIAHVAKNADVYRDPSMHIGGWNSPYTGHVHLEPSQNVADRPTAERLGRERNQVSVWDNEHMSDVLTGGTGK